MLNDLKFYKKYCNFIDKEMLDQFEDDILNENIKLLLYAIKFIEENDKEELFTRLTNRVIIDKARYESLIDTENQLEHLESEGVDNWGGYSRWDSEDEYDE